MRDGGHEHVAVLGGGIMGLTVARLLALAGSRVTLYEAAPEIGGASASFRLQDYTVDRFYHTILPGDTALLDLIGDLGLSDRVSWRTAKTGFFRGDSIHSISTLLEFLRFPVLTPRERLRLGWALMRARRDAGYRSISHLTCAEWLGQTCGPSIYRKLWQPLIKAKLGKAGARVSASFMWATMNRLQAAKRSSGRLQNSDELGFIRGGYAVVLDRLREVLVSMGVELRTGCPIIGLERGPRGLEVATAAGRAAYRAVVATMPYPVTRRLAESSQTIESERMPIIECLGVIAEVLLLQSPLSPFYILNLGEEDLSITGVIEATNLAPKGYFGHRGLAYLPRYLTQDDPMWQLEDAEISRRFRHDLARVFPGFRDDQVVASAMQRARLVQPIHTTDYVSRIPPQQPFPGLWIASSAQIHPWPLNNDQIVRQAKRVVQSLLTEQGAA